MCSPLSCSALGVATAWGSPLRVLMSSTPNKTSTNRTAKTIDAIVIHDTEGRFIGSVRTLRNPRVDGSAHFVVSRDGQIVQLVPVRDVAWHSGNGWWNLHSIGIEHEGWAGRRGYTLPSTARPRSSWPTSRTAGVSRPTAGTSSATPRCRTRITPASAAACRTTPTPGPTGTGLYMRLVRYYAAHRVLPTFVKRMPLHDSHRSRACAHSPALRAAPRHRVRPVVDRHATVHGPTLWWSGIDTWRQAQRRIWKVEFRVDGRLLYTDHTWPYSFHRTVGWDSRTVANGRHMLERPRLRRTPLPRLEAGAYPSREPAASHPRHRGRLRRRGVRPLTLTARVSGAVERVSLYADGHAVARDERAPYTLRWDTRTCLRARTGCSSTRADRHGHRAALPLPVVVANASIFPAGLARNWVTHHVGAGVDFADG